MNAPPWDGTGSKPPEQADVFPPGRWRIRIVPSKRAAILAALLLLLAAILSAAWLSGLPGGGGSAGIDDRATATFSDTPASTPVTLADLSGGPPAATAGERSQAATAEPTPSRPVVGQDPTPTPLPASPTRLPVAIPGRGLTTEDAVNMRSGPDTSYRIVAQLPVDTPAQVLAQSEGWYHIVTPWQADGWVAAEFFRAADPPATDQEPALGSGATVGVVNLRNGPGSDFPAIASLDDSTVLEVLSIQGGWYKVRTPHGLTGWVSAEYVPLDWIPGVYGGNSLAPDISSDVVRIAQKYLGARYVWGGSDPSGFDCSGLAWYVYSKVDVWLPAGSYQQFSGDYGRYIGKMSALAPGDLVFFERTTDEGGITHVGIYVGGGEMIAARSERLGVRYVSLQDPFWSSRFVGGIRPYR